MCDFLSFWNTYVGHFLPFLQWQSDPELPDIFQLTHWSYYNSRPCPHRQVFFFVCVSLIWTVITCALSIYTFKYDNVITHKLTSRLSVMLHTLMRQTITVMMYSPPPCVTNPVRMELIITLQWHFTKYSSSHPATHVRTDRAGHKVDPGGLC